MPLKPYHLPPLASLASFEAAARHVSFKKAADELNVTPAAVSHQVKALEKELQVALFRRNQRGVELTQAGQMLMEALRHGFEHMSGAIRQIRQMADNTAVTIHSTTAVSFFWLTPRLSRFWKSHGHIAVNQQVSDEQSRSPISELSIVYGAMAKETAECHELFQDEIMVLASPRFMAQHGPITLQDIARLPLIHLNVEDTSWTGWQSWGEAAGFTGTPNAGVTVNNYSIALQAAQDDMGLVLGWRQLTQKLIDNGLLCQALPQVIPAPHNFYIKNRRNASEKALLLRDWLLADVKHVHSD